MASRTQERVVWRAILREVVGTELEGAGLKRSQEKKGLLPLLISSPASFQVQGSQPGEN